MTYNPSPRELVSDVRRRIADHPHGWLPSDITTMRRLVDELDASLTEGERLSQRPTLEKVRQAVRDAWDERSTLSVSLAVLALFPTPGGGECFECHRDGDHKMSCSHREGKGTRLSMEGGDTRG